MSKFPFFSLLFVGLLVASLPAATQAGDCVQSDTFSAALGPLPSLSGSCCQNHVCGLPCPKPVPKPDRGMLPTTIFFTDNLSDISPIRIHGFDFESIQVNFRYFITVIKYFIIALRNDNNHCWPHIQRITRVYRYIQPSPVQLRKDHSCSSFNSLFRPTVLPRNTQ